MYLSVTIAYETTPLLQCIEYKIYTYTVCTVPIPKNNILRWNYYYRMEVSDIHNSLIIFIITVIK